MEYQLNENYDFIKQPDLAGPLKNSTNQLIWRQTWRSLQWHNWPLEMDRIERKYGVPTMVSYMMWANRDCGEMVGIMSIGQDKTLPTP